MHTQLPENVLGTATVERCRNLWWSLYIIDRHFSPSLGLPMTFQDSDITTLINTPNSSPQNLTFSLQVKITRMLSFIIGSMFCLLHIFILVLNLVFQRSYLQNGKNSTFCLFGDNSQYLRDHGKIRRRD